MTDQRFLWWIHERLVKVHGEREMTDYMHHLRHIISNTNPKQETANVARCDTAPDLLRKKFDTSLNRRSYEASMLHNLLAVIHGDGGHYLEQHGLEKTLADAEAAVVARFHALRELVALEDMKDRLHQLHEMGHGTDYSDYKRRQSMAWRSARGSLSD